MTQARLPVVAIVASLASSIGPHPGCAGSTWTGAHIAQMRPGLRNLITAQEARREGSRRFAGTIAALGESFPAATGLTATIDHADDKDRSAHAPRAELAQLCRVSAGADAGSATGALGVACDPDQGDASNRERQRNSDAVVLAMFVLASVEPWRRKWHSVPLVLAAGTGPRHAAVRRPPRGDTARPGSPSEKAEPVLRRSCHDQARSKRSRFITLVHAATKSLTNFSLASAQP